MPMRVMVRIGLALLVMLGLSTTVVAQTVDDRVSFNASVGPSFANLGTTFSTTAGLEVDLIDRVAVVGEFGMMPHAPFRDASEVVRPLAAIGAGANRVNAYHWNGNLKVRPFEVGRIEPYLTAGLGSFIAEAVENDSRIGSTTFDQRRRVTDFATNLGAGLRYRFNDWIGVSADYRTFFVHRDDTPLVNRFVTGLSLSLK